MTFSIVMQNVEFYRYPNQLKKDMTCSIVFESPELDENEVVVIGNLKISEVSADGINDWKFIITVSSATQWYVLQMMFNPMILKKLRESGCVTAASSAIDLDYDTFEAVKGFKVTSDDASCEIEAYNLFMQETENKFLNLPDFEGPFAVIEANSEQHANIINEANNFIITMLMEENFAKAGQFIEENL